MSCFCIISVGSCAWKDRSMQHPGTCRPPLVLAATSYQNKYYKRCSFDFIHTFVLCIVQFRKHHKIFIISDHYSESTIASRVLSARLPYLLTLICSCLLFGSESVVVVIVALLFYVHGKHLWSYRDGQLT